MKELFEVKLIYTAIILADNSFEAERIATEEHSEIVRDSLGPDSVEGGVSFRSRTELADHGARSGLQWDAMCVPYGGDGDTRIGDYLDAMEEADQQPSGKCPGTVDMFKASEPAGPPDFRLQVARRHAKAGDSWQWCSMEYIGDNETGGALIEGGEPNITPDGKRRWTGVPTERVFVFEEQVRQAALAYEAETGKCMQCGGSGQVNTGWSSAEGNTYATCTRCAGTGKAVAQ